MANEAPARKAIPLRLVIIVSAAAVVLVGIKMYPYIIILHTYATRLNVRWIPFTLVMLAAVVLLSAIHGVWHLTHKDHCN